MASQRIQLRRGTATQWTAANPTLSSGEIGVETDTSKFKIGDGATTWSSLTYAALAGSSIVPLMDGVATPGTVSTAAHGDHVHPTDTSRLAATDPSVTNARTPTSHASTHASGGTDPVSIAQSQVINLSTTLSSFITGTSAAATYAPLISPTLTGTVTIPTAATSDNSPTAASTAYVQSNLVSYLTTAAATSTYATQSSLSSYLTTANAATTYVSLTASQTVTGTKTFSGDVTIFDSTAWPIIQGRFGISGNAFTASNALGNGSIYRQIFTGTSPATLTLQTTSSGSRDQRVENAGTADLTVVVSPADSDKIRFEGTSGLTSIVLHAGEAVEFQTSYPVWNAWRVGQRLVSPAFTGTPTAPTAAAGTKTTQLATTAFAMSASGAAYNTLHERSAMMTDLYLTTANTVYALSSGTSAQALSSGQTSPNLTVQAIYLDPADYVVSGMSTVLRLRGIILSNSVAAPAGTYKLGLYALSLPTGAADTESYTFSSTATGNEASFVNPAASSALHVETADFAMPSAAGWYVLGFQGSVAWISTTDTVFDLTAHLQIRHV